MTPLAAIYSMPKVMKDILNTSPLVQSDGNTYPCRSNYQFSDYIDEKIEAMEIWHLDKDKELIPCFQSISKDIIEFKYFSEDIEDLKEIILNNKKNWIEVFRAFVIDTAVLSILYDYHYFHIVCKDSVEEFFGNEEGSYNFSLYVYPYLNSSLVNVLNSPDCLHNYTDRTFLDFMCHHARQMNIDPGSIKSGYLTEGTDVNLFIDDSIFEPLLKVFSVLMTRSLFRTKIFMIMSNVLDRYEFSSEAYSYFNFTDSLSNTCDIKGVLFERLNAETRKDFLEEYSKVRYRSLLALLLACDNIFYIRKDETK